MSVEKTTAGCFIAILSFVFITPLWYYLLYRILSAVHADTPMWVCYWVYAPLGFLVGSIKAIFDSMKD